MLQVAHDPHISVLLLGESGTGKERIAQAIHRASSRRDAPFVVIDCAGLSPSLAEDALFGHVRGAFTGAVEERAGPFERANGGTVLLDEVGDLGPDLQIKLLRAVQSRVVQRLGGRSETAFDVRIIAATNVDLTAAVARGRFREDLYYRLNVYRIDVPPLRRRGADDIRLLATAILQRLSIRRHRAPPLLDDELSTTLTEWKWPGNVRELENVLERILVAASGCDRLTNRHLPDDFGRHAEWKGTKLHAAAPSSVRVLEALERNQFRAARTAADLGLSRHQLYRLVRRHGIRRPGGVR